LFLLALGVRMLPWRAVFDGPHTRPFGNDAFYHLRRIAWSVHNFPGVLDFDLYLNHPEGAKPIWTPYLDWITAGVLWALGIEEVDSIDRAAVFVPPLLGAATVTVLFFTARRHFGFATAGLAALILSVLSAHFWYSQIGFVDHHAAVALASTLLLAACLALVTPAAPGLRAAPLAVGVMLGVALLVWPGSLLHVGLAESGLFAFMLTRRTTADARRVAGEIAAANALAFALVLPAGLGSDWPQWGPVSPVVLTYFQPWLFAALAMAAAACAALWRFEPLGSGELHRAGLAAGVAGALLAVSAGAFPELLAGLEDGWRWIAKSEGFQARVAESQPLVLQGGHFSGEVAAARLSYFVFVFPLALVLAARAAWRRSPALGQVVWWSLGLFVVTLVQKRFFNSFSVVLALMMAWTLQWALAALPERWHVTPGLRRTARAAAASIVLLCLWPVFESYEPHLKNQLRWLGDGSLQLSPTSARRQATTQMAVWLRTSTPETSGWLDERVPEYGVLAPWPTGHVIVHEGRRPTVAGNFGDDVGEANFDKARRYYLLDEAAGAEILEELGVRYVVAQEFSNFLGEEPGPYSLFRSLYALDGNGTPEGEEGARVRPLERHRLIYESSHMGERWSGSKPASYKVYEFVGGARLVGSARPGARVRASVPLRTNRRRDILYSTSTLADARGRYVLRVPYANQGGPPDVIVGPFYRLECEGDVKEAIVDERKVRRGGSIRAPRLCSPAATN
jgi:dolichyl-diphosphooligosaccharide--protein glycosyltransferase